MALFAPMRLMLLFASGRLIDFIWYFRLKELGIVLFARFVEVKDERRNKNSTSGIFSTINREGGVEGIYRSRRYESSVRGARLEPTVYLLRLIWSPQKPPGMLAGPRPPDKLTNSRDLLFLVALRCRASGRRQGRLFAVDPWTPGIRPQLIHNRRFFCSFTRGKRKSGNGMRHALAPFLVSLPVLTGCLPARHRKAEFPSLRTHCCM